MCGLPVAGKRIGERLSGQFTVWAKGKRGSGAGAGDGVLGQQAGHRVLRTQRLRVHACDLGNRSAGVRAAASRRRVMRAAVHRVRDCRTTPALPDKDARPRAVHQACPEHTRDGHGRDERCGPRSHRGRHPAAEGPGTHLPARSPPGLPLIRPCPARRRNFSATPAHRRTARPNGPGTRPRDGHAPLPTRPHPHPPGRAPDTPGRTAQRVI